MYLNQKVYIDNQDGTFTPALYKGDSSSTEHELCFVKPKEKFIKGGYGMTITCLKKFVVESIEDK